MMKAEVTILLPQYRTLELTSLCLQLIEKNTPKELYKIIVIDNDSRDASVDYLRRLPHIQLIERNANEGEAVYLAHARALDMGLAQVDTPYVLSIHTDTLVRHPRWLPYLLSKIKQHENIAGVGSWKLEAKPWWRCACKALERWFQKRQKTYRHEHDEHYLRSHCALYRTDLLKKYGLQFDMHNNMPAGKAMHQALSHKNHQMIFLSSEALGKYVDHINHATMVLNPELGADKRTIRSGMKRIQRCQKTHGLPYTTVF